MHLRKGSVRVLKNGYINFEPKKEGNTMTDGMNYFFKLLRMAIAEIRMDIINTADCIGRILSRKKSKKSGAGK